MKKVTFSLDLNVKYLLHSTVIKINPLITITMARRTPKMKGFKFIDNQHNGQLFMRLDSEDMVHKRVRKHSGVVQSYVPTRATDFHLKLFGQQVSG